ncbi:MAG: MFS transporter [Armatimonadetes bacterium]|nr:MFS transporter [Armatimonadota bacterium]
MRPRSTDLALLAAVFLDMVGFTMLIPDIQLRAEAMLGGIAFKGPIIGALLQSTFIVQLFASPRWGRWADSTGRRKVFVFCQWISSLAMLVYGAAGSVALLFLSRILAGFGGANVSVAQAMAAVAAGDNRKKILGWVSATLSAGMIFGPAVGGFAAEKFGSHAIGYVGAIISFAGGLVVLLFVPKDQGSHEEQEPSNPIFDLSIFRSYPRLLPFFWIAVTASFALATLEGTFGRLIHAMLGYGQKEFGLIFSYEAILGIFVSVVALNWLAKRMCDTTLLRTGYVVQGIGLGLNPLAGYLSQYASGMVWLLVASTLYSFGSGVVGPTLSTLASNTVPEKIQGELFGTMQSARTVGFIVGPILGGFLFDIWHPGPYVFAAIVCLVVAIALPAICACHGRPVTAE